MILKNFETNVAELKVSDKDTSVIEFLESKSDFEQYGLKRSFKFNFPLVVDGKEDKGYGDKKRRRVIKGHAAAYAKDRVDDIITKEALEDAKDHLLEKGSNTVFYNHDRDKAIGRVLSTDIDNIGLIVEILISSAKDVDDIWIKMEEKVLNSLSIAGRFKKVQIERDDQGRVIAFKVLKLELFEVSVVGIPMNPKADIYSVAEKSFKNLLDNKKEKEMTDKEKAELEKKEAEKKELEKKEAEKKQNEVPVITMKGVEEAIDSKINPLLKSIESLAASVTKLAEGLADKINVEPKEDKAVEESESVKLLKKIEKDVDNLKNKVNLPPSRKGTVVEEDEEEDGLGEAPKKSLISIDDPETVQYVKHVMDNEEEFEALNAGEKAKAKSLYMFLMLKSKKVNKG